MSNGFLPLGTDINNLNAAIQDVRTKIDVIRQIELSYAYISGLHDSGNTNLLMRTWGTTDAGASAINSLRNIYYRIGSLRNSMAHSMNVVERLARSSYINNQYKGELDTGSGASGFSGGGGGGGSMFGMNENHML